MRKTARCQRCDCRPRAEPRLAIIDTQSVECTGVHGPRSHNGIEELVGRKRFGVVDVGGRWPAVAAGGAGPADVQDRDTLLAVEVDEQNWPSLRLTILDGFFTTRGCQERHNLHGMRHRVVEKAPNQKRFVILEER